MNVPKSAVRELKSSHPSDEILLDKDALESLMSFYDVVVGQRDNGICDIILSQTVPIRDLRIILEEDPETYRFCVFENALDNLDEAPDGRPLLVAAVLEERSAKLTLLGVIKGEDSATISDMTFDTSGNEIGRTDTARVSGLWHMWCAAEFALLHPTTKTVFVTPGKRKEYSREKDESGKRRRVVRYIRRHVLNASDVRHPLREVTRHCLCWYVIGHWRHLSNGRTVYVRGHWKGELRDLERNLDDGRHREIVLPEA